MGAAIANELLVAVTGAQGVGKSTFCSNLHNVLSAALDIPVHILPSIGDELKSMGIPFGSDSTDVSIVQIYSAHLRRHQARPRHGIVVMDRCAADALCYVRALNLNAPHEHTLLELISFNLAEEIDLVIHLEATGIFSETKASHESYDLRRHISQILPSVLSELGTHHITMNAAEPDALDRAKRAVIEAMSR